MSDTFEKPGAASFWISVLAIIGCFLIFAVVLYVSYIPTRQTTVGVPAGMTAEERLEKNLLTPEERKARLAELRVRAQAEAAGYQWINREAGVVRLPVDRAVELTVRELQEKQGSR